MRYINSDFELALAIETNEEASGSTKSWMSAPFGTSSRALMVTETTASAHGN